MEKQKQTLFASCASCELELNKRICMTEEGTGSKGCPTLTRKQVLIDANKEYKVQEVREFARQASIQEAECYANRHQRPYILQPTKTRIIEICDFAGKMNFGRLGLVFCIGMTKEAGIVEEILKSWGFEVISAVCKAGRTPKSIIGI